ncbi:nucleoside phosphorylase domain-containing protein [Hypoxylon rubiginosum]|uniref:Nucleoside phosphorylase domain-containing protein n=1 Tax=Hypoxylon rubiginosum TaxID=110542 RepID=A0ACB9YYC9_9PEZI|nr:nucleoside phosphorylase domain-containing protein [Hypoxylon rubiginosum]
MDIFDPLQISDDGCTCEDYTIGWICVLAKEQTAAMMMLDKRHPDIQKQSNDPNTYNLGSIGQHNVVIACLPLSLNGSNTVATIAVWMTSTFPSIRLCLLVGIGSGIPPKVRLGDVVVGMPYNGLPGVVGWQLGKHEAYEKTDEMRHPPSILISALTKLESIHEIQGSRMVEYLAKVKQHKRLALSYLVSDALQDPFLEKDDHEKTNERHVDGVATPEVNDSLKMESTQNIKPETRETKIHYGLIASTSFPIKDKATRGNLNSSLGNDRLLCIDTEVSDLTINFPCIVIRGICDYADEQNSACSSWQKPAAAVSAAFAKEVLSVLPEAEVAHLPTIKSMGPSAF